MRAAFPSRKDEPARTWDGSIRPRQRDRKCVSKGALAHGAVAEYLIQRQALPFSGLHRPPNINDTCYSPKLRRDKNFFRQGFRYLSQLIFLSHRFLNETLQGVPSI